MHFFYVSPSKKTRPSLPLDRIQTPLWSYKYMYEK